MGGKHRHRALPDYGQTSKFSEIQFGFQDSNFQSINIPNHK